VKFRLTAGAALVICALLLVAAPASARTLHPMTTTIGSADPSSGALTIPHWSSSFSYNGVTYPYTMVGSSPFTGSRQTTVATRILPIRLVFADGTVLDGSDNVGKLVASPLFQPANFISGKTQYGDAVQRAEFWKETEGTSYHAWLAQPLVRPTTTIHVPAGYGQVYHLQSGVTIGQVRIGWFFYHVITQLLHSQNIRPTVLPIYVTQDVLLQFGNNPNNCCVFGFHGAEKNGLNTYAWSSYLSPGIFAPRYGLRDVNGFSHEISEWYNDPFVNNIVPEWFTPTAPQYGCTNALESGDPLVGFSFNKNGYSLQDEAFFSWFAREDPSQGINGWYTLRNNFSGPAQGC
jgi:hypothetical protein